MNFDNINSKFNINLKPNFDLDVKESLFIDKKISTHIQNNLTVKSKKIVNWNPQNEIRVIKNEEIFGQKIKNEKGIAYSFFSKLRSPDSKLRRIAEKKHYRSLKAQDVKEIKKTADNALVTMKERRLVKNYRRLVEKHEFVFKKEDYTEHFQKRVRNVIKRYKREIHARKKAKQEMRKK